LCGLVIGSIGVAHQDDPKEQDRVPRYEGPAWRRDVDKTPVTDLGFDADGVTLMSWLPLGEFGSHASGNDSWGYVSDSGREYAIIGLSDGTAWVEITNPGNAQIVAVLDGPNSLWRDIKVLGHHAYAVSEGGDGIQVFDMSNIDAGAVTHVNTVTSGGTTATHNVAIDTTSEYLYRAGGSSNGLRIYDLSDPVNPSYVGDWSERYVHDVQVVTYTDGQYAGREIAFVCGGFNSGWESTGLYIVDVTNKSNPFIVSYTSYGQSAYCHQGWLDADRKYFYVNDELDEQNFGGQTNTRIFNVENLSSPFMAGTCSSGSTSVDHNLYVRDDLLMEANYRSGFRLFDISDRENPVHIGYFDTWPGDDNASFNGLWNVYPFFPSGIVIGSDLERGLFVWDIALPELEISLPDGAPDLISPANGSIRVRVAAVNEGEVDTDSLILTFDAGDGATELSLEETGETDIYVADFPALECAAQINWFAEASSVSGQHRTLPAGAPATSYTATAGDDRITVFEDDFNSNLGWTVQDDSGLADGTWNRGIPAGGGDRGDPPSDGDGSGSCYLTDNVSGNSDVDDGCTYLFSPTLDASESGLALSYWRWYSNNFGADPNNDIFRVWASDDGGTSWVAVETVGPGGPEAGGGWFHVEIPLASIAGLDPTDQLILRFDACDENAGSVIEAAIDGVAISAIECDPTCTADVTGDGLVGIADLLFVIAEWGESNSDADADNSGSVDVGDILIIMDGWGPC
jgi:choice-of-anchor B domain-containing protein